MYPPRTALLNRDSPQATGLLAWWPTVDAQPGFVRDHAGCHHLVRQTIPPNQIVDNRFGPVARFNGSGGVGLKEPQSKLLAGATQASVSWWQRFDVEGQISAPFSMYSNEYIPLVYVYTHTTNGYFRILWDTGGANYITAFSLTHTLGRWYHLAFTYNAGSMLLYRDGVQLSATVAGTLPTSISTAARTVSVGYNVAGSGQWTGLLGDMRIYGKVLSANEIGAMYRFPWALYAKEKRNRYYAAAGAAAFKTAWAQRVNTLLGGGFD